MGALISDLALLDFKQPVPESGQIELNSIAERYFLAPTQIGEIRREDHLRRFLFLWLQPRKSLLPAVAQCLPKMADDLSSFKHSLSSINHSPTSLKSPKP